MSKEAFYHLFVRELCSMYDAEVQILKALPGLISSSTTPELREALQKHLEETRQQVKRLDKIFNILKEQRIPIECEAMKGLIDSGKEVLNSKEFSDLVKDAAIISAAQCVEHYEIAKYGALKTFAHELELNHEVKDLLEKSLAEEGHANKKLTEIAEGGFFTAGVNQKALKR